MAAEWRVYGDWIQLSDLEQYNLALDADQRATVLEARLESHAVLLNEFAEHVQNAKAEREAYRQAGARLLQAFQRRFCFLEDTLEYCLRTVDMEVEIAAKGGQDEPSRSS